MTSTKPKPGAPGTTDQWPRWEGPPENRPRGYLPPLDDPTRDPDAMGETEADDAKPEEGKRRRERGKRGEQTP